MAPVRYRMKKILKVIAAHRITEGSLLYELYLIL
jgi:hypothetical protein